MYKNKIMTFDMTLCLTPVFKDQSQSVIILTTTVEKLVKTFKSTHKNMKILLELPINTCSVCSSPKDGAFPRLSDSVVLFVLRQHLGQAKITDFHPHLALHQNVSCGQVSVDVSLSGKVVHTLKYEYNQTERGICFIYAKK